MRKKYPAASLEPMHSRYPEQLDFWIKSLLRYLRREQIRLDLPLDVPSEIRKPCEPSRALAPANRVAIVIPCHRVIRGSGHLGGYRWGVERKRVLIDSERSVRPAAGVAIR